MDRESRLHLHRTWEDLAREHRRERRRWWALMVLLFVGFVAAAVWAAMEAK